MRRFFNLTVAITICTAFIFTACEDNFTDIGSNLIDTETTADFYLLDVKTYNFNGDSIRSDAKVSQNAAIGVYEEPVFGRTKAKFISQARLGELSPKFGENAVMDSVILSIPVYFKKDDESIESDTVYVYLPEGETPSDSATVRITKTYKLDSIHGNTSLPITFQVREVSEYLYSQDTVYYSNPNIPGCTGCENINDIQVFPNILGSAQVEDKVSTVQQFKLNNPPSAEPPVVIKVPLDENYFKQKFIDNEGSSDLNDQAAFIRNFFRGIEISIPETQGFLVNFNPHSSDFRLNMYYTYDNPVEDDGSEGYKPRLQKSKYLMFTSYWSESGGNNVQVNQFEHTNRSSAFVNAYTNPNISEGDSRLYLAGMEGTRTYVELDQDQLNAIRDSVLIKDWAIVGAELILNADDSYGLKKPPFLFAWHEYTENGNKKEQNFSDISKFINIYPLAVQFNPMYDYKENPKTYTIRVTDYIKGIAERGEVYENNRIVVSLGNFLLSPASSYTDIANKNSPFFNDRSFNHHRIILHGNKSEQEDKRPQLKVYYTKR